MKLQSFCYSCQKTYNNVRRFDAKARAVEYMGGKCFDCSGVFDPVAFDFHHKDSTGKDVGVGNLLRNGWRRVKDELDKCIMLCSNCHRVRHKGEGRPERLSVSA